MRRLLLVACALSCAVVPTTAGATTIKVLSNRADLISGGDALVRVTPVGARVTVNGRNVTSAFAQRPNGQYLALLTGLKDGANRVVARKGRRAARLTIRNHPIGGPVTAGPQIAPWTCFDGSLDKQCNRPVAYAFKYKRTAGGGLADYDPGDPPSDVATTTTDSGKTVPFIVREEVGTLDRDQYRIAALYDPAKPSAPWATQEGLNHRLVIFHGFSCDTQYMQADAPDVLNETALAHGFVTMSHALNNAGHNCNIVTQAESMIMTKEKVIEQFGPLRWTIGSGCSGGSLVQQQVANAYPGLYQAIAPQCSFTDAWSSAMQYVNYQLLRGYFEAPAKWQPGVVWTPDNIAAVEGHISPANAISFTTVIPSSGDPSRDCPGVPADQVYDPATNPTGVRCSLHDYMRNVFGPRKSDGFTGRPMGNIGIQYGLKPMLAGKISLEQFLDVNEKIGSFDIDYNPVPERMDADRPALDRVYRSGAVNQGDNLDKVAIIDLRGPDPGAFHDVYRTYTMRARLMRNFGTAANQILWRGPVPLMGDAHYADQAIVALDRWMAAVASDRRSVPRAQKIIEDKPADITERCTDGAGTAQPASSCDATVLAYSDPQLEAGMSETDDTLRCELKPLDKGDYPGVTFTDPQWTRMTTVFAQGVCDYSKPGVGRHPTSVWQTYQDKKGNVIYGGRPLGKAPASQGYRVKRTPR
jgi:hypothetical protein